MPSRSIKSAVGKELPSQHDDQRPTLAALLAGPAMMTIPEAGRACGLGKSASYRAARVGFLPTVRLSEGRVGVPLNAFLKRFWGVEVQEGGALSQK